MPDAQLDSQRLFADRWLCCVWAGNSAVGDRMTMDDYLRLGHLVYSMGRVQPASIVDQHLERSRVPRRIEFTVESFLLAPFLLEGTDLVTVVPERAVPHLRRTAAIRVLDPPVALPGITERYGGTRGTPPTPRTPGSAPTSPRSPPSWTRMVLRCRKVGMAELSGLSGGCNGWRVGDRAGYRPVARQPRREGGGARPQAR